MLSYFLYSEFVCRFLSGTVINALFFASHCGMFGHESGTKDTWFQCALFCDRPHNTSFAVVSKLDKTSTMIKDSLHLSREKRPSIEKWPMEDSMELTIGRLDHDSPVPEGRKKLDSPCDIPADSGTDIDDSINNDTRARQRRVTFSPLGRAKKTLSLKSYKAEEKARCWYDRDEYAEMRQRIITNALRMESGKPPKKGDTYRGLENKTRLGKSNLIRNLCNGKAAVLKEQASQRQDNTYDVDSIASLYAGATACSGMVAAAAGLQDECDARVIFDEVSNMVPPINKRRKKRISRTSSKKVKKVQDLLAVPGCTERSSRESTDPETKKD